MPEAAKPPHPSDPRALPPLGPDALADRVLLITGAGAGLGRATALACAAAGATVVLLGRTVAKLEATFDAITELPEAAEPAIYPLHLAGASDRELHECIQRINEGCGGLHGIVHCAAQWQDFRPMQEVPPQDWAQIVQANLTAPWSLTRIAWPHLKAATDGCVVFADCACSREPAAYFGAFGAARAGLRGMVAGWAREKPGVRLHLFDPGPMRTATRLLGYPGTVPESLPLPDAAAERLSALLNPACGARPELSGQLDWAMPPVPASPDASSSSSPADPPPAAGR